MRTIAVLALVAAVAPLRSIADDETSTAGPDDDTSQPAFDFAFYVFQDFRVTPKLGIVYSPVLNDHLGVYKRKEPAVSTNRDPTVNSHAEKLFYDGLELTIERDLNDGALTEIWLQHVRITDSRYELRGGLRVGQPLSEFWRILWPGGEHHAPEKTFDAVGYERVGDFTLAGNATVFFEVSETNAVTAIDIDYGAE